MYNGMVNVCGIDTAKLPRLKDKEADVLLKSKRRGQSYKTVRIIALVGKRLQRSKTVRVGEIF